MAKFGIGQPVRRVEDRRFVSGRGRYVDDLIFPNMAFAAVVYSPHAHADILSCDVEAARGAPGVIAILTGAEAVADKLGGLPPLFMPADMGGPPGFATVRPVMVADRVRCVGDRIAIVVAETIDEARDAADLIVFDFAVLPAIVSPDAAADPVAVRIWEDCPGNTSFTLHLGDCPASAPMRQIEGFR